MTCVCGLPIERGHLLPWTHAVNPGAAHHYARPLRASSGVPSPTAAVPPSAAVVVEGTPDVREPSIRHTAGE